ncbi:hypothetical protein [Streptomyces sp. NPDC055006]
MSDTLTFAQILAAQNSDPAALGERMAATSAVVAATESRVVKLAQSAARRMAPGGPRYMDYVDQFTQDGRVAVWEALSRFKGDSVDVFFGFIYSTVETKLLDAVRSERNPGAGVDEDAVKVFGKMLVMAEGDVYLAERFARTIPKTKDRLGAGRAQAARLAWQGTSSIDKPSGSNESSVSDTLAAPQDEIPAEILPKVGHGAALEALQVLDRYTGLVAGLPHSGEDVDAIEDSVWVPREAKVRRYVLDAIAILRSYVSTIAAGELASELRDESDDRRDERAAKITNVHKVLDDMGAQQYAALVNSFGIGGRQSFHNDETDRNDNAGMAEVMGCTKSQAQLALTNGKKSFAKRFIALVAKSEAHATELTKAAAKMLTRGGQK